MTVALKALAPRLADAALVPTSRRSSRPWRSRCRATCMQWREPVRPKSAWVSFRGSGSVAGRMATSLLYGYPHTDGIGTVGAGAHASKEHVIGESLPVRALLMRQIIEKLAAS